MLKQQHFKMATIIPKRTPGQVLMFCLLFSQIHRSFPINLVDYEELLLWESKSDGVTLFRTPMLVNVTNGDLLAFTEARKFSAGDAGAKFVAVRRSPDEGFTWKPSAFILDDFHAQDGINFGAVLVDQGTKTVFLLYSYCGHLANCTPGPDSEAAGTYLIQSRDHGYSWSKPVNMLDLMPDIDYIEPIAFGPGYGIQKQLKPNIGRLIACGHTNEYVARTMLCVYSDDHGKTWSLNERFYSIPFNETKSAHDLVPGEVQVIELPSGNLFLTVRNTHAYRCHCRMQLTSYDGGETFPLQNAFFDETLIDPNCFASMLRHKDFVFFSNPASTTDRVNMTVRWSKDYGASWAGALVIHGGRSAYSCLSQISNDYIGLLYEKDGGYVSFVKMRIEPN